MISIIFMQIYLEVNAESCIFANIKLNKNTRYESKS
jgi:hypothetical protein